MDECKPLPRGSGGGGTGVGSESTPPVSSDVKTPPVSPALAVAASPVTPAAAVGEKRIARDLDDTAGRRRLTLHGPRLVSALTSG